MRTIIITLILGLALGFLGCPPQEKTIKDGQEIVVEDKTDNFEEEGAKEEDEKHLDNVAELLEDLTFLK